MPPSDRLAPQQDVLTRAELARELGIADSALTRWKASCPLRFGLPLRPATTPARPAEHYPLAVLEELRADRAALLAGRFADEKGVVWVNAARALEMLRPVQPTLTPQTLHLWAERKCVHHPDGKLPKHPRERQLHFGPLRQSWYREIDILAIRDSLQAAKEGRYGEPSNPHLTPTAIRREVAGGKGPTYATLRKWERQGKIASQCFDNKRGGGGDKKRTYPPATVEHLVGERKSRHNGVYPGPPVRVNFAEAARLLAVTPHMVRVFVRQGLLHDGAWRKPPGRGRQERTVLRDEVMGLVAKRHTLRSAPRPAGNWKTVTEALAHFGATTAGERIALSCALSTLQGDGSGVASQFPRREKQLRLVWYYDVDKVAHRLAREGVSVMDWARGQYQRAKEESLRAEAPAADGLTPAAASPDQGRERKQRRGRKRSTQTLAVGEFCYERLAAGDKRRTICRLVQERFNRHMGESDITIYARRYATGNGRPWPL